MVIRSVTVQGFTLLGLLAIGVAHAEPGDPLSDRFSLSLGTFLLETETDIRVDGAASNGTEFDAERTLGMNDSDRFRVDGYWRFKKRHKLRIQYFDTKRSAQKTIETEIDYGDTVFPVNAEVSSTFDTSVAELAYEYSFLRRETYEVTGTFGIHQIRFDLGLSATQLATGEPLELSRSAKANGPLPVIGLRGTWRFHEKWYLDGQAQFFRISLDPYDGRLEDYTASIVWMPLKHVGIGAGWNEFVTHLDVSSNDFEGRLRWRYGGARIFLIASF